MNTKNKKALVEEKQKLRERLAEIEVLEEETDYKKINDLPFEISRLFKKELETLGDLTCFTQAEKIKAEVSYEADFRIMPFTQQIESGEITVKITPPRAYKFFDECERDLLALHLDELENLSPKIKTQLQKLWKFQDAFYKKLVAFADENDIYIDEVIASAEDLIYDVYKV